MSEVRVASYNGGVVTLHDRDLGRLTSGLQGTIVREGDEAYEEARAIWNAMIDLRPALIVRCAAASDVVKAVDFAREHGLLLSIRGGGHNIAGKALSNAGLTIDLSSMRGVRVDPERRRAYVQAGATLADFDEKAQEHGLATPLGINSTTGVAGLTLGGGFGWLSRKYGMTIDNLLSAELVTADGRQVRASQRENPDLFWAIRGGSGNFGVITQFEFQLHPVGPEVLSGLVVYPIEQARDALRAYATFAPAMPDDLNVWVVLRQAPPLPFLPEHVHGSEVVVFAICYAGDPAEGEVLIEPVRSFAGQPVGEHVGVQPYASWQKAFDPLLTPGARNYWKSHNVRDISDGLIDAVVEQTKRLPGDQCEIFFGAIGGATERVAPTATAYAHRDARYVMNVHGRWQTPEEDAIGVAWAREVFEVTQPYASSGVYVNFLTEDEADRVDMAYGPNHARLAELKAQYDPDNLFRLNQNIRPARAPN